MGVLPPKSRQISPVCVVTQGHVDIGGLYRNGSTPSPLCHDRAGRVGMKAKEVTQLPSNTWKSRLHTAGVADQQHQGDKPGRYYCTTISYAMAWMRKIYPPPVLLFIICCRLETWPWGQDNRITVPNPDQLHHSGFQALQLS